MAQTRRAPVHQTLRFKKLIRAPLSFVFQWCTDYRDDDDRITDSIYHYRARIVLREPNRVVRIIRVPGKDTNRCTDVEIIHLHPPNHWNLTKLSWTDDEVGDYRLTARSSQFTLLEMRFKRTWKAGHLPSLARYKVLFDRVWDRYVEVMEAEYGQRSVRRRRITRP
jgi:hypothetical protein